jgi:signal peptidase II
MPDVPAAVPAAGAGAGSRSLPVLAVAVGVVAADQGTKLWALSRLAGNRVVELPGGWVDLQLISNPGAAFSVGSGATWLFTLLAAGAVAIVPWVCCPGPVSGPGDSAEPAAGRRGRQPQ